MTMPLMINIFEKLKEHGKNQDFKKVIYKAIPSIYHSVPADEDLYALYRSGAKLIGRNPPAFSCLRKEDLT